MGAAAVSVDACRVGALVTFPDQGGQVLEVAAVGRPTKHDLDDGGIPDRPGGVVTPLLARLRHRLEHGHGGDPSAAAFSHQGGQRRQWGEVADLIQRHQQRRVQPGTRRAGRDASCDFYKVFDERRHQRRRCPGSRSSRHRDARIAAALPIGRVATTGEIAAAILWLASPETSFTVGHDLVVDGAGTH